MMLLITVIELQLVLGRFLWMQGDAGNAPRDLLGKQLACEGCMDCILSIPNKGGVVYLYIEHHC